jgi:hypothetical protein
VVYYLQAVGDDERPETDRIYIRPGVTEHHFMGWINFLSDQNFLAGKTAFQARIDPTARPKPAC